jgi:chromosomal replication initiator protein
VFCRWEPPSHYDRCDQAYARGSYQVDCQEIWAVARDKLQTLLDRDGYERYLAGIVPVKFDAVTNTLTLGVLNDFAALWLESNYQDIISEVLHDIVGGKVMIAFEGGHGPTDVTPPKAEVVIAKATPAKQKKSIGCRPDYTFDTFIVGNGNKVSYAAAKAVCEKPGHGYNPLFIYGGSGLGKTHLLQAIANEVSVTNPSARIEFRTSEEFVNSYIEALQSKTVPAFRRHFRSLDILLIDDVQFFEGKVGSSEEFFHTFNTLHNSHRQIVLASDRTPKDISGLEKRLVSRFDCGLSAEILLPDLETRLAILKKKQESQTVKLSDEVLYLIASRIPSNIRSLEGALTKLIMNISLFGSEMTIEKAEELLSDKFENETDKLSIDRIQRCVANCYDLRITDILSKKRPQNIARPRMIAMYLSRKLTENSLPAIGEAFNRNHATIIHGVATIERKLANDENLRTTMNALTRQLRSQS